MYLQILVTFYSLIHSFISNISSFHLLFSDHTSPLLQKKGEMEGRYLPNVCSL